MYNLPYYKENDPQVLRKFMHQHPFAFLTGCDQQQRPVATQIPVFIEERDGRLFLSGHIMRNTDHHKAFAANPNVLCVFTGPHAYVSATWYKDPHQASTWNYMSVHAKGRMEFLGEDHLIAILRKTSLHFEGNDASSTTAYDNLSPAYTARLLHAIVAFEVAVESLETVFKLSQNRDLESYRNIRSKLAAGDADAAAIAKEMEEREEVLFSTKQ